MITSINKDNAGKYTALFGKATQAWKDYQASIGEPVTDWSITDLESYFSVIKDLFTIDPKYTILPLDEEYFNIDANSRVITVPPSFKKNGIAVQGDEVAEILYFKINRYFDFTDLDQTQIYIQWEQVGVNNPAKGVSTPWVKDIESDPDYLIFGWPLDSEITATAGPIKFSVRFIQWNKDNKIEYSFSTLDAQATINPALDFEDVDLVIDPSINNMISERLKNTQPTRGSIADEPIYLLPLQEVEVDLGEGGKYVLRVQAYSPDAGVLSYSWKQVSLDGKTTKTLISGYDYIEITDKDAVLKDNVVYYKIKSIEDDGTVIYEPLVPDSDDVVIGDLTAEKVFEKYATLEVTGTGQYYSVVTNRVNASTKENLSGPTIVPGPENTEFTPDGSAGLIMKEANEYKVKLSPTITNNTAKSFKYQWYKNNLAIEGATNCEYEVVGDGVTADLQGQYTLKVIANRNNSDGETISNPYVVTYPAAKPIVSDNTNGSAAVVAGSTITVDVSYDNDYHMGNNSISYQWYYTNATNTSRTAIAGATGKTYETSSSEAGMRLVCEVENTYNNDTNKGYSSIITVVIN